MTAIANAGGTIVEVLEQGASPGAPTTADMDGWILTYGLKTSVVRPLDGNTAQLEGREWAYLINLSTMEIEWKGFGSYGNTNNSSAKQGIAELKSVLGL